MSLSSLQLDAFFEVAKTGSFSKAAKNLSLTQSALSQRVLNLETEIGNTLFLREPSGIRMTELGEELLRYCQKRLVLEEDFVGKLGNSASDKLSGRVRIAGISSVMTSIILPSLQALLLEHPEVQIESSIREVRDLFPLLKTGAVEFLISSDDHHPDGIRRILLGHEENILIQPVKYTSRNHLFLDHDPEDQTTLEFMKKNGRKIQTIKRSYLDHIDAILDGVKLGFGSAVVPRHLAEEALKSTDSFQIVKNLKPLKVPIYLFHYDQPYYSKLESEVLKAFTSKSLKGLSD